MRECEVRAKALLTGSLRRLLQQPRLGQAKARVPGRKDGTQLPEYPRCLLAGNWDVEWKEDLNPGTSMWASQVVS